MSSYHFSLKIPAGTCCSVSELLRQLLIPRKWRHYLRVEKKVLVNDNYRNFNELVYPQDQVDLELDQVTSQQHSYPASGSLPQVVYEDANLLVINKPAGQKTHPNQGENGTALNDCATYLGYSPYIVHRLDMLTSGLLLVAKNPAVVPILNRELSQKIMKRDYIAQTAQLGQLKQAGTISLKIGPDPFDQRKRRVTPQGQTAITYYRISQQKPGQITLALSLASGRTHQIRVHLAAMGAPIIGDPLYNPDFKPGQKLHLTAISLKLILPFSLTSKVIHLN